MTDAVAGAGAAVAVGVDPRVTEFVEVHVGRIGRAHGIRGDLVVESRTDEPDRRFAAGTVLRTDAGRRLTVADHRWHSGRLLVRFEQVPDRTAAEAVRGQLLLADVPAAEVPADEGEFYDRQLIGLAVLDAAGTSVGTVTAVVHLPAQDALEIETTDGPRLVPFVTALVPVVDLAAGELRLADVSGLLSDEPDPPESA